MIQRCFRDSCWASSWDSWEGFLHDHFNGLSAEDRRRLQEQWADAIVKGTVSAEQLRMIHVGSRNLPISEDSVSEFLGTCWRIFFHREDWDDFKSP